MNHVGDISTEGGPFLIADAGAIRAWRGTEDEYLALCHALEAQGQGVGLPWPIGGLSAVGWDPEGEGTADVFVQNDGGLLILRGWFDGDWETATREAASRPRTGGHPIGDVEVPSGVLALLWSPEDGRCVCDSDLRARTGRPTGTLSIDGSTLLVAVSQRRFRCAADRVAIAAGDALRCIVDPA